MNDFSGFAALILAAGASSRMGVLKPLLPVGNKKVIERVVRSFQTAGITDVRAVLGFRADQLRPILDRLGVPWVINGEFTSGMMSSIKTGVRALDGECRAFFLIPADMPFVRPATIEALVLAFTRRRNGMEGHADLWVCHPCYQGRRGHPPLITAALIPEILAFDEPGGLRILLARHENRSLHIDGDDPGILIDLNTPEDYWRHRHL